MAGGRTGRGARDSRPGRPAPGSGRHAGRPSGTTATGVTAAGSPSVRRASQPDHSARVLAAPPRPSAAAPRRRFCTAGKTPAVEGGRADRREHGPPAAHAGDDDHRHVLEVVGLPLPGLEERVVAGSGCAGRAGRPTSPGGRCGRAGGGRRGRGPRRTRSGGAGRRSRGWRARAA